MRLGYSYRYRVQQVRRMLGANVSEPVLPPDAQRRLTEAILQQFRILPAVDQQHLVAVYHRLIHVGAEDETITAGLLHDIGKACANCNITIFDRSLHVILRNLASGPYAKFAAMESPPPFARALYVLANHARRGAIALEQQGYADRVIELVRNHEQGGRAGDTQLKLLREADRHV